MKKMKRFMSLMLALVLAMAMGITAFAQKVTPETTDDDNATITINNPARGEEYTIYKLFDATVSADGEQIAYQGTVPEGLEDFFEADDNGYIHAKDSIADEKDESGNIISTKMTEDLKAALENWAKTATAMATAESNGEATLEFTGLPYGYYVITTSNIDGDTAKAAITVDSTQPNASIYDKNVNKPSADKKVDQESYSIGDTVKYTGTFGTTNYITKDTDTPDKSKQVVDYFIEDTLPEYLGNVVVTKISIGIGEDLRVFEGEELKDLQFKEVIDPEPDADKNVGNVKGITIPWAEKDDEGNYKNLYVQGAVITIEYEAILTSVTNINADDKNTISIRPIVVNGTGEPDDKEPWDEKWFDDEVIRTYAAAIKKTDELGNALAGAEFTIKGLQAEKIGDGVYRVISYNPDSEESSTVLSTSEKDDEDANISKGMLYIVGFAEDVKPVVTEYKAPDGYNKLLEDKILNVQTMTEEIFTESGTRYYDKDGNLVAEEENATHTETVSKNLSDLNEDALKIENNKGTLLPSTGGIGTTIFYVVGAILVLGAGILLVTKKRMSAR